MPAPETRTFKDVEEEASRLIDSLNDINVSRHSQGGRAARWHETDVPFTVLEGPSSLTHLLYEVWIQDAPNSELSRGAEVGGDEEQVTISARMKVQIAYKLRPKLQKADARMATEAARDVVRVLMQPWDYDTNGCVDLLLINAMSVQLTIDGGYVVIAQDYIVEFDLDNSAITPLNPEA